MEEILMIFFLFGVFPRKVQKLGASLYGFMEKESVKRCKNCETSSRVFYGYYAEIINEVTGFLSVSIYGGVITRKARYFGS